MISERDVIYITKKQASIAVVALAAFCILVFMLGYFWGKQCVLDGFGQRIAQESMSDTADYELMMQSFADRTKSDTSAVADYAQESNQAIQDQLPDMQGQLDAVDQSEAAESSKPVVAEKEKDKKNSSAGKKSNKVTSAPSHKKHHAILVGFELKQNAAAFVQRLQDRGITTHVKTRVSKSASGKTKKMWYQVVTDSYDSMDELEQVIAQIKKTERIKSNGIKIN